MGKVTRDIDKIRISPDDKLDFGAKLEKMRLDAEEFKGNWDSLHEENMQAYLTIPEQETRTFPWPKASNFFAPLVRVVMDGLLSQIFDAMLANDLKVNGFGSEDEEQARKLSLFYSQYVWKKVVELQSVGNDWLFNTLLDGTAVLKNRWSKDMVLKRREFVDEIAIEQPEINLLLPGFAPSLDFDERITEEIVAERAEVPMVESVPMTRLFVAPGTKASLQYPDCKWFFEESWLTWEELVARKRIGYEGVDEELMAHLKEAEVEPTEKEKRESEELSQSKEERKIKVLTYFMREVLPAEYIDSEGATRTQRFRDPEGIPEEVVVVYFPATSRIAKITPLSRIRPDGQRPYIDNRYKRVPDFFFALGVPAAMRQMQRITNALFNQMIDSGTLANLPYFFYEPGATGLLPDAGQIEPGRMIPTRDVSKVRPQIAPHDRQFFAQGLNTVQQWWERDSAINDFTLGKSSALPNAPRTIGQQQLNLAQSNIAFSRLVALMSMPFLDLIRQVHVLYMKHAPRTLEFTIFNENTRLLERVKLNRTALELDVDFSFELSPNRQQEQTTNQQLFQLLGAIPFIQQDPGRLRVLAKQLYESLGKKNFEEVWPSNAPEIQQAQALVPPDVAGTPDLEPPLEEPEIADEDQPEVL